MTNRKIAITISRNDDVCKCVKSIVKDARTRPDCTHLVVIYDFAYDMTMLKLKMLDLFANAIEEEKDILVTLDNGTEIKFMSLFSYLSEQKTFMHFFSPIYSYFIANDLSFDTCVLVNQKISIDCMKGMLVYYSTEKKTTARGKSDVRMMAPLDEFSKQYDGFISIGDLTALLQDMSYLYLLDNESSPIVLDYEVCKECCDNHAQMDKEYRVISRIKIYKPHCFRLGNKMFIGKECPFYAELFLKQLNGEMACN